jgi:hypothetical protein
MAKKISKFRKKIYVTGLGYKGIILPKSYGDLMTDRYVDVTILSNGNIVIKPVNKKVDMNEK